ncbi:MAG: histidine phosphatase family protein [Burkholderiales bacterium]|nr:histidine phosphatase family protein [Burkholderiales bacterium]
MSLWLVRHAQPLVAPGVCYGALDVSAHPEATLRSAQALARVLPVQIAVRVSPLQRCGQLAQVLQALRPDLAFATDVRLQEMNFGAWEGVAWSQIPPAALERWTDDFGEHRFGGVECANGVLQRVAGVWAEACALQSPSAWITHAGVIRAANLLSQGQTTVTQADQWPREAPGFGAWQALRLAYQ